MGRRSLAGGVTVLAVLAALSGCGLGGDNAVRQNTASASSVAIAIPYPQTGAYAEFGKEEKQGFDLALDKVNKEGGLKGKQLELKYYDTQSDPKQSAAIAPKIAADQSVIAVLGDYSSPASSAASPIYQKSKIVQYGFNSTADSYTQAGDYIWSPMYNTTDWSTYSADVVAKTGVKTVSVVYLETDWGKQRFNAFKDEAAKQGVNIVYESAFLPDTSDYSPILIKARDAKPEAVVHIGYAPDGAQIANTLRDKLGYAGLYFGGLDAQEYLTNGGKNVENSILNGDPPADTQEAREYRQAFKARYGTEPLGPATHAYQAIIDLAYAANKTEPTREGILKALQTVTDFPHLEGDGTPFAFDQSTHRPKGLLPSVLTVRNGQFVRITENDLASIGKH